MKLLLIEDELALSEALTEMLRTQGFALVETPGLDKLVPEADAKLQSSAVIATSAPPAARPAIRGPRGRHVTGRAGTASESAGMDVGGQDAAGTDLVEVVHHPVHLVAGDHRAHRGPS